MPRWMRNNSLVFLFLAACSFVGCNNQTDLTGYHRANQRTEKTSSVAKSDATEPVPELPATADISVASNDSSGSKSEPTTNAPDVIAPVSALVPVNVVDGNKVKALMSIPSVDTKVAPESAVANPPTPGGITDASQSTQPRKVEVLVKEKKFSLDKTGALRVSFDDLDLLKVLNMEPVVVNATELMPEWLRGLNGKTIRLRGFMYPTYDTEGIEHFVLARDNQICCFGRDPKIYDLVQVDMKAGKTTNYIPATRAFDVVGKFKIDMLAEDGKPYGLYVLEQADVIDR